MITAMIATIIDVAITSLADWKYALVGQCILIIVVPVSISNGFSVQWLKYKKGSIGKIKHHNSQKVKNK